MTTKTPATLAAAVAVAMLTGCGDSARPDPAAPEAPAAKSSGSVSIKDFKFVTDRLSVKVGAKVAFTNVDRAPHTATAKPGFDTGVLRQGQSKVVTITKAGTFAYVCELHPYMKATIVAR